MLWWIVSKPRTPSRRPRRRRKPALKLAIERSVPKVQEIGREAADFILTDLDGTARRLSGAVADHKAAVVVFWSGICSHCNRYDEYLNAFSGRHPDIVLLAVASRPPETPEML